VNTRSVIARSVPEHPVPRRIRLLLCAVAVTAAVVAPAGSLSAVPDQVVGGSTAAPGTSIVVTAVTPWVEPDGDFRIGMRVDGPLPADAVLTTQIHQRLRASRTTTLRGALERVIASDDAGPPLQSPRDRTVASLGDAATGVVVDIPIRGTRSGDSERVLLPNPGIHPVTVSVADAAGTELASTIVFLNRLPDTMPVSRDGSPAAVSLSVYALVDGPAALRPSGQADLDPATREQLSALASTLESGVPGPITLAVRPNLLDALDRSEDPTDRNILRVLRSATSGSTPATVAGMPYVDVDVGSLSESADGRGEVLRQIALTNSTVQHVLGVEPVGTTWYDGDSVTEASLPFLEVLGARRAAIPADDLRLHDPRSTPDGARSLAVGLPPSTLTATAPDESLSRLLDEGANGSDDEPGPGQRANQVVATLMATWYPAAAESGSAGGSEFPGPATLLRTPVGTGPAVLAALYAALADPGPITLDPGAVPTAAAAVDGEPVTAQVPADGPTDPGPALREVLDTRRSIDGYRSLAPSATAEAAEWDRIDAQTLHVDMSAADRDTYHRRILADIGVLVAQIEMPPERQVLLTDREATIPLRFRNDLPYAVDVQLWIRSVRLDVGGGDRRIVTLRPGENRVDLPVTVRAPGGTLLRIDASSPDGALALPAVAIPVTSRTISGVGAALSVLSLLFLAGWWTVSIRRERRRRGPERGPGAATDR